MLISLKAPKMESRLVGQPGSKGVAENHERQAIENRSACAKTRIHQGLLGSVRDYVYLLGPRDAEAPLQRLCWHIECLLPAPNLPDLPSHTNPYQP